MSLALLDASLEEILFFSTTIHSLYFRVQVRSFLLGSVNCYVLDVLYTVL